LNQVGVLIGFINVAILSSLVLDNSVIYYS